MSALAISAIVISGVLLILVIILAIIYFYRTRPKTRKYGIERITRDNAFEGYNGASAPNGRHSNSSTISENEVQVSHRSSRGGGSRGAGSRRR